MDALVQSASLHERARAFVRAWEHSTPMPEPWEALALDLAAFQAQHIAGTARLHTTSAAPDGTCLTRVEDIPAVSADVFRFAPVSVFPGTGRAFRTSGTTHGERGVHWIRDLSTYDAGALALGRKWLVGDLSERPIVLSLVAPPAVAPDSSLSHMVGLFCDNLGLPAVGTETFFVGEAGVDVNAVFRRLSQLRGTTPVLVLATSFALMYLMDASPGVRFGLPKGSRIMTTGGFKGRTRELEPDAFRAEVAATFGVAPRFVVSEYGMTELSSQFYEATIVDPDARPGVYREPPWAKVIPVLPGTLRPVPDGEVGLARIIDLLNVDSSVAILTHDLVRRVPSGFELLGRDPAAALRGCSLSIEEAMTGDGAQS